MARRRRGDSDRRGAGRGRGGAGAAEDLGVDHREILRAAEGDQRGVAAHLHDLPPQVLDRVVVRRADAPAAAREAGVGGQAHDDSVKDLRRKIVKMGGNTALITFGGSEDLSMVYAEVSVSYTHLTLP